MDDANPITAYRKKHNLQLKELAERTGISAGTLSRLSCGRRPPRRSTAKRLAEATDGEITFGLKLKEQ